jgi:hypothetical protein
MHSPGRLVALAVATWLVWCPMVFALPALSAPACHGPQEEAVDCCQPLAPAAAPVMVASSLATPPMLGAGAALVPPFVLRVTATPTRLAAPPAGWGRLYLSLSVFLN